MTSKIQPDSTIVDVSVITTCAGRNRHLYNLLSSLAQGSIRPAEIIIVNDDADPIRLAQYPLNIVQVPTSDYKPTSAAVSALPTISESSKSIKKTGFDIGHNRNLGAAKATYNSLIFLDVDCVVASNFVAQLTTKLQAYPDALLMAQPRYLTRALSEIEGSQLQQGAFSDAQLDTLSVYNPYRHNLTKDAVKQAGIEQTQDYGAFWSLCFAITRKQFERIGGFDTHYVGYGAEDTDFAFMARDLNIEFYLTTDVIYHQQHSVYRPPLNHLASIVINANRFYDKWQHWPMSGWLETFANRQIINWKANQQGSIIIIREPTEAEVNDAHCPDAPYV